MVEKSSKPKNPKSSKKTTISKPTKKTSAKNSQYIKLPSSLSLLSDSFNFITANIKILSGITAVYAVLYLIFIRAGSSFDVEGTNEIIRDSLGDNAILNKTVLTGTLISSGGGSSSSTGGPYSFILLVIGTLAFVWAIRHLMAGKKFKIRDTFYSGMYPLIPFVIVLFIISMQLIPFVVGGFLYSTAELNGLISTLLERVLFIILWIALSSLSAYWLANSLMAIYAVTLPDIYPMQALRSTKQVIKGRRWNVLSRILILILFLALVAVCVLLITVSLVPVIAVYIYDLLMILGLLFANIYMFKLYRSLI